jgi:tripartite-type tricarboxylate transporter receptor subunit TctC
LLQSGKCQNNAEKPGRVRVGPTRRRILRQLAGFGVIPAASRLAWAVDYPSRPIHLLNGFAPGGQVDIFARLLGQQLSDRLGQSFVVDSRPGAATNIATEEVVHAAPDGYTLLWITTANAVNASLYEKINFNFIRDIAPVAGIDTAPLVMEVNPSFPAKTVSAFIDYAKANPGKISYGSGGVGSTQHVAGELFKFVTGIDMVHVPYRGAVPVLNDLLAGRVQATFSPLSSSLGYIHSGQLRVLAVTTAKRSETLPDIPTVAESVPGFEAGTWDGIGVPTGTPADIIAKLNQAYTATVTDPAIKSKLADFGGEPMPMTPADFGKLIATETDKWAKVIKFANIKAE